MKKVVTLCLLLIFLFSLNVTGVYGKYSESIEPLNPDTIITKDNIYEVLEHCDLDPNNLVKKEGPFTVDGNSVTVREFENTINKIRQLPEKTNNTYYVTKNDPNSEVSIRSTGVTVSTQRDYDNDPLYLTMEYTASGIAEISPTPHWKSYWKSANWGDVEIVDGTTFYEHTMKNKQVLTSVENPNTQNSVLVLEATYDIDHYFLGVFAQTTNHDDTVNFDSSFLPNG